MFYLVVFLNASKNFPEFAGCFGKVYPGQEPPRTPRILPREVLMPKRFKANLIDIKLAKRHLQRIKYSGVLVPEVFATSEDNNSYTCENGQIQNVFLSGETSSCEVTPKVVIEERNEERLLVPELGATSEDGHLQNVFLNEKTSSCEVTPTVIEERKCCGLPEVEC